LAGIGRIVVGNLGSTDGTDRICAEYGAEVIPVRFDGDYAKVRNNLAAEGMNLYLDPWEVLASGAEKIKNYERTTRIYVVQGGIVSKEIRIWRDIKFVNPIYETLVDDTADCDPNVVILSGVQPDNRNEKMSICREWISRKPTSPDPYYYMACSCLANRMYKEFFSFADQYLIMDSKAGASGILLRYYMAQVHLHTGNLNEATKNALSCLSVCPTFSEFWCLLGDILYKDQKYEKARRMYENSIIIGKRRLSKDSFPIEISKYKEYPKKMIENIQQLISQSKFIVQKTI
jgi:tetratricopeptide (TPR) repeat protein